MSVSEEERARMFEMDTAIKGATSVNEEIGKSGEPSEEEVEKLFQMRTHLVKEECEISGPHLDMGTSAIDDLDAMTISIYLNENKQSVKMIHFGGNHITDEGLIGILAGIQWQNNTLQELYLGNNPISPLGISALIDTLPLLQSLQALGYAQLANFQTLSQIGLEDDEGILLFNNLIVQELPKMKTLSLAQNQLSDEFFLMLSILYAGNKVNLRTLHLGDNPVTEAGLTSLFKCLKSNQSLKELYLNDIIFQNDAVDALAKLLQSNAALETLNLGNTAFDDESITLLKPGLMTNDTLKAIHLWGNEITNDGAQILAEIMQNHNHSIVCITLFKNNIEDEDLIEEIQDIAKQNASIRNIETMKDITNTRPTTAPVKPTPIEEEEYEDDWESEEDEKKDEIELKNIEKEISDAEHEVEVKKQEYKKSKKDGKVWTGFKKGKKDGLLHSEFAQE